MSKSKKRLAIVLIALALVFSTVLSLAYFTDYEQATAKGTAGTLELALDQDWASATNAKPGDIYALDYTLTNKGNKSADVRETFVITSDVKLSDTPAEFEIYLLSDVEADANGIYTPKSGANPLTVISATDTGRSAGSYTAEGKTYYTITYKLPEFILNGTGTNAEIETGVSTNAKTASYVVLFSTAASNDFQGANITIEYLAEAKQHRNTDDSIWTVVVEKTAITLGGVDYYAVPANN